LTASLQRFPVATSPTSHLPPNQQQHQRRPTPTNPQAGKDINTNIIWTSASLVLTRIFQVYTQAQTQKAQAQQDMSAQLYDAMQDSQEGVVSRRLGWTAWVASGVVFLHCLALASIAQLQGGDWFKASAT
jgi:hypothetical protein